MRVSMIRSLILASGLALLLTVAAIPAQRSAVDRLEEPLLFGPNGVDLAAPSSPVLALALSPDGKTLAVASEDKSVRLEDPRTGEVRHTLKGHTNPVSAIAFAPDGKTLATIGKDGSAVLWTMTQ